MKKQTLSKEQKAILKRIETYWNKHPELRFGQVLWSLSIIQPETSIVPVKDPFHNLDSDILKRMK